MGEAGPALVGDGLRDLCGFPQPLQFGLHLGALAQVQICIQGALLSPCGV